MKIELIAKPHKVKLKDGKEITIYTFSLVREDGFQVRIMPYHYEDDKGNTYDTRRELVALSTIVKE